MRSATSKREEQNRVDQQREEQLVDDIDNDDVSTPFLQHHHRAPGSRGVLNGSTFSPSSSTTTVMEKELEPSFSLSKLRTWRDAFRGPQVRYYPEGGRGLEPNSALAWFVFLATVVLEVFTATGNVFLVIYGSASEIPFKEFVIAAYPRMIFWIGLSYLTHGKRFWEQYLKVYILPSHFRSTLNNNITTFILLLPSPSYFFLRS